MQFRPFRKRGVGGIFRVTLQSPTQVQSSLLAEKSKLTPSYTYGSGNYIADFYAPAAKLILELDGAQHVELQQAKYDAQRTRDLEQRGLKVLRFDDRQALLQTESVLEAIFQAVTNPS